MFIDHRLPATALAFCLSTGAACATTDEPAVGPTFAQSPINIVTADAEYRDDLPPMVFKYATSTRLGIVDTRPAFGDDENATIRADVCPVCGQVHAMSTMDVASSLMIGDITYDLLQFHLHAPGEHRIDGTPGAMELHLVHQAQNPDGTRNINGALAVVGQIITIDEEDKENEALAPYFAALSDLAATVVDGPPGAAIAVLDFNLDALLPGDRSTYRYTGSLTAPPASDEELEEFFGPVAWNIFAQGITVSEGQFEAFRGLFEGEEGNARGVQVNDPTPVVFTDVAPIPLPATGLLFVFALGGLAALRRRAA